MHRVVCYAISTFRMSFEHQTFITGHFINFSTAVYGDLNQFTYGETKMHFECIERTNGFDENTPLGFHEINAEIGLFSAEAFHLTGAMELFCATSIEIEDKRQNCK